MRSDIPFPLGGLNDNRSFDEQPPSTTEEAVNMRGVDPKTGRARGAQRSGTSRYNTDALAAGKIRNLSKVTYDNTTTTFANRASGSESTEFAKASRTVSDSVNVCTDRQGNQFWIDGRASVVKFNPSGTKLWMLPLPTTDTGHQCLALTVDESDNVIVGVSAGGQQSTARLWSYAQEEDNKTRLLWELDLGGYIEEVRVKNAKLYALVNKPDIGAAEVVTLESYNAPNPTETQRFKAPASSNGLDVGLDGSVFVAADALSTRGQNPVAPEASPTSEDWNPTMLTKWGQRAWAWYDASDPDAFNITNASGAPDEDGGEITVWFDKTENGRHLLAAPDLTGQNFRGPYYRSRGSSGKPCAYFNGVDVNAVTATTKMVSGTNVSTTDAFEQLTSVPGYAGSMFVLFMVVKATNKSDMQWLFGVDTAGSPIHRMFINREASSTLAGTNTKGCVSWYELATGTSGQGLNVHPNHGVFSSLNPWNQTTNAGAQMNVKDDWMVLTLVYSNGVSGFESYLRVNGNPVDVWDSTAATWTDAFQLGQVNTPSTAATEAPSTNCLPFQGEIMEILTLREYTNAAGNTALIELPDYPDVVWAGNSNTEIEKVEGYLAHKWGCSHVFPMETVGRLTFLAAPNTGDSVVIGSTTYTFRTNSAAFTGTNNEVSIGGSAAAAALNIIRAVNQTGTAGTDYDTSMTPNGQAWAMPVVIPDTAGLNQAFFRCRTTIASGSATFTTTESTAGARMSWTDTLSEISLDPSGGAAIYENDGYYPHPFTMFRTGSSTGGPPRQADADYTNPSKAALLNSRYAMVSKHAAEGGRPRWVAVSGYDGSTTGIGGVGYHVRIGSDGEVFTCGPRQAATGDVVADNKDVRRIVDSGDTFSLSGSAWSAAPGVLTYAHPRMAVDKYDNLYLPFLGGASGSIIVYHKTSGTVLLTATGITEDPVGYAIAIDLNYPEFPDGYTNPRARFVYLATPKTSSNYALYKVGLVSQAAASVTPRTTLLLGVVAGAIYTVTTAAVASPTSGTGYTGFDTNAKLVCSTVLFKKLYYTDGVSYFVYDPKVGANGTISPWKATSSGVIPERMRLICTWRGRIVLARSSDNPSLWAMSKLGDPLNWDFFPPDITADQAVIGTTARAGLCPDIVNALIPYSDDLLIFGGDSSIWRLTGDPMTGGQFDLVSDVTGMSFGPCWDKDPNGVLYFFGSRGGVYRMVPGGVPVSLTDGRIERRLRDVDLETNYVQCIWDTRENGLHVFVIPYGAASAHLTHWFWEQKTDAWWEDEFGVTTSVTIQPTSAIVFDGDDPDDRRLLIGCGDGRVRVIDEDAKDDDNGTGNAQTVDSRVLFGPFESTDPNLEMRFSGLVAQLAGDQDGTNYEVYVSDSPDVRGAVRTRGYLHAGRNDRVPFAARGTYFWIRFRNAAMGERWAFEAASIEAHTAGLRRVRV